MMNPTTKALFGLATALAFSFLASCSTQSARPIADISILQNKRIATTEVYTPAFQAMTPGGASMSAFGPIGAAAASSIMSSKGREIIQTNKVPDPSIKVSQDLSATLQKKCSMKFVGKIQASNTKPADFGKLAPQADYVLDVQTVIWNLMYFPSSWGTYKVTTLSTCRLVDCKTGKIVASGIYSRNPDKGEHSFSYEGLIENQAAGLKRELRSAEAESVNYFRTSVLKL